MFQGGSQERDRGDQACHSRRWTHRWAPRWAPLLAFSHFLPHFRWIYHLSGPLFFSLPRSFTATSWRFLIAPDQFLRFACEWKQRHVAVWLFWSEPVKKANWWRMDLIGPHRCFKRRSALRCSALYFSRKLLERGGLLAHSEERAGTVTRHILRSKKAFCFRLHFKLDFISGTTTMAPTRSLLPTGRQKRWFGLLESLSAWIYL